jgi:hypothetical protein
MFRPNVDRSRAPTFIDEYWSIVGPKACFGRFMQGTAEIQRWADPAEGSRPMNIPVVASVNSANSPIVNAMQVFGSGFHIGQPRITFK